jgi:hypothetical protein
MDLDNLDSFRKQIAEAQATIHKLYPLRRKVDERIADLKDLIRASANFLPEEERKAELLSLEMLKVPETIAEAVKIALFIAAGRKTSLTPIEIKATAEERGFDFSSYSNPMASIHTLLKRMKDTTPPEVGFDENTGKWSLLFKLVPDDVTDEDFYERLNSRAWKYMINEEREVADKVGLEVIKTYIEEISTKKRKR